MALERKKVNGVEWERTGEIWHAVEDGVINVDLTIDYSDDGKPEYYYFEEHNNGYSTDVGSFASASDKFKDALTYIKEDEGID